MENIVVIGAGVVGLSCAYNLLKSGEKVTLLERDRPVVGSQRELVAVYATYMEPKKTSACHS